MSVITTAQEPPMPRPFNPFTHRYVPPARPDPVTVVNILRAHGGDAARVDMLAEQWDVGARPAKTSKQAGNRNRVRGDRAEARCRADMKDAGWWYNTDRTGSYGPSDLTFLRDAGVAPADRPGVDTLMVQVKSTINFKPSMLNDACHDIAKRIPSLPLSIGIEVWAWLYNVGWVAKVRLHQDGRLTGCGPHSEEVIQSIKKSRVTRAQSTKTPKTQRPQSFRERLEQ